ncbi:antibiotic acetyltransferase [Methylomonas sp. LL1]|uniref:DapH/DapD/GlmU-related protein n=1 Tax=Methylomonas sp. LL1 TaxID=2785785 RepID=UPI0018C3D2F0|nr:DapH/DapD/GlmU-related protein [Methylomonas sp. LL1]QPK62727.1 antibiotic acetyltransferase [Methylomonas sp. LL1]
MKNIRIFFRFIKCFCQRIYYRLSSVDQTAYIAFGSDISRDLIAEAFSYIGHGAIIGPKVSIGTYSMLGPRVMCLGDDHRFDLVGVPTIFSGRPNLRSTLIGRDVWIGAGVVILAGVEIGDGAIVAAGSVVSKNIPPCEIHAGVPNKKVRDRFENIEDKNRHLEMLLQPPQMGDFAGAKETQQY